MLPEWWWKGKLSLETMTVLLGGMIPHVGMLLCFKWLQMFCLPYLFDMTAQRAWVHVYPCTQDTYPECMDIHLQLTNWWIYSTSMHSEMEKCIFTLNSFYLHHEFIMFLLHYLSLTCYGTTCKGAKDGYTVHKTSCLSPLCLSLTQSLTTSTGKGNGSMSLKNVPNSLLCFCRSTQQLPSLKGRIWPSLTARCWP